MSFSVIADIQGNMTALDALDLSSGDVIICLGDIASGPFPNAVVDRLRELTVVAVRGNMDDVILNPPEPTDRYGEIDMWCHEQLTEQNRSWLASLPLTLTAEHIFACHGSPQSNEDVIDCTTPDDVLAEYFGGLREKIILVSHLHHQFLRHWNNHMIANPGSVGLPNAGQNGKRPCQAAYLILEPTSPPHVRFDFKTISYSADKLRQDILNSGMPHVEWYTDQWES